MPYTPIPEPVLKALREMHPDTFTQAAILRLYGEAPGLLSEHTALTLQAAYAHPDSTTTDPKGA